MIASLRKLKLKTWKTQMTLKVTDKIDTYR